MTEKTERFNNYQQTMLEEEKKELANNSELISGFKKFCASKGLELRDENFQYLHTIGIVAFFPNIVGHIYPDLVKDKEGLVDFASLCKSFRRRRFASGYLYDESVMLMAHPYFRRAFSHFNNYAPRFIEFFWEVDDAKINPFIALDFDRVRIDVNDRFYMELDTWYGARFNNDVGQIPDGLSKLRPPMDLSEDIIELLFKNAYSLDTKWVTKDGIRSFQLEEFKTNKVRIIKDGHEYHPVRYIHSEYDLLKGYFRHFDGAIHFYTADEYYSRRDSDFNYNLKGSNQIKTISEKLFKMNGVVELEMWIQFTSHFLSGNPLIFEYFEGAYPAQIADAIDAIRNKAVK